MNTGFWNPFIWIIAKTTGYNIYSITLEEMFYILVGGWGFYKICLEFFKKETAILSGISYMACGYTVGHLQHFCWITGTAFFPYVLLFFVRVHKNTTLKNFVAGAFSSFLFLAATHPGLIIGAIYFFVFLVGFIFLYRKSFCATLFSDKFWIVNGLFLAFTLALSSVVIYSDIDVLKNVSRGLKLSTEQMLMNPTTFQSYLSLLVPLAVNKSSFFQTDISMRNCYLGIAGLIGILLLLKQASLRIIIVTSIPLLFFLFLSAGGYFKIIFSKIFPLVGYVRMNGEFTYFATFILLFLATAALNYYSHSKENGEIKKILQNLIWLFWGLIVIAIVNLLISGGSFPISFQSSLNTKQKIKHLIDNLNFTHLLLIGSFVQLGSLILIKRFCGQKIVSFSIVALNLIVTTWLILPFTGLGMRSKKEFTNTISVFEKGIHPPELQSINNTRYLDSSLLNDLWMIPSYSKKIGYPKEELYPIQVKSNLSFFADRAVVNFITKQAYIFLSSDTSITARTCFDSTNIQVQDFRPGYIKASINNTGYSYITFLQNDYPYWYVKINNKESSHFTGFKTFITAPVENGKNSVEFIFDPYPIKKSLWFSISLAIAGFIILAIPRWRNYVILPKKK
ncbi:MAG: hypothetical protein JST09_04815 [Bacteroidetes bacterium]|nr:hypothetical protein [Bacteroidota bacterium]